jgi:auxin influx carrier (AUX1 LAX family)
MCPAVLSIWLFAAAFPFYGAINTLMTGLTSPLLMYVVPCLAFLLHYRHKAHRENSVYPLAK